MAGKKQVRLWREPSGQLTFAKPKKPKAKPTRKTQMVRNAGRAVMKIFALDKAHYQFHEANRGLLELCNRFLKTPAEERSAKDAFNILEGLKRFKKMVKEKGQLKVPFPE